MIQDRQDCLMRHDNGNCLVAGGFCTSVSDSICEALHRAYDCGKRSINPEDLRPHGKWIGIGYEGYSDGNPVYDYWECSECGNEEDGEDVPEKNPYCRHCGAKMDK